MLRQILDTYPAITTGGELFNPNKIKAGNIPWPTELEGLSELNTLRATDPVAFLEMLFRRGAQPNCQAIGFKLMYGHGNSYVTVVRHLAQDTAMRVFHVKRRNLLRRLLSHERAKATDLWALGRLAQAPALPRLRLDLQQCISNFRWIEAQQARYDITFKGHPSFEVFYEDMAAAWAIVQAGALKFLGLRLPQRRSIIWSQKMGADSLQDAIENYDELRRGLSRWPQFFDD